MSHPTCCSVSFDRCDRCDLLVDLEGFHLMSVARTLDALVLDVESCNQLVGWPSAANSFAPVSRSRRWIPSKGQQERHRLACSKDATSVPGAFHIVTLAADAPGEVRRRVQ